MIVTKDGSIFIDYESERKEISGSGGGQSDEVGVIKLFGGSNAPDGWLLCDGSAVSRTTYSDLFALIGTAYGEGDGSTTFNLPNIKGKTVVGLDSSDTDFNTIGKTGGEKTHKLTIDEMPTHDHNITKNTNDNLVLMAQAQNKFGDAGTGTGAGWYWNRGVPKQGGNKSHNNLQPYIVLNYIIKASATTSIQSEVIDNLDGDSTTNTPSVHAIKNQFMFNQIILDVNDIDKVGMFFTNASTINLPVNGSLGFLVSLASGLSQNAGRTQVWFRYRDNGIYIRQYNKVNSNSDGTNLAWSDWKLEGNNFSTDEIIIGTYLGKPLYRKVLNLGTLTGTTATSHQTGLTNVKYLTKFEGTCTCENTYGMKLPTNGDQIDSVIFRARLENNFSILKTERSNNSFQNVFFTIEYTKTTD